jgi:hypothetical protein
MSIPFLTQNGLSPNAAEQPSLPPRLVAVCGDHAQIHPLILQSLLARAARGEPLALVVGDNRFDAYRLARLARARGLDPGVILSRLAVTRAFTCYQLHGCLADPKGFPHNRHFSGNWSSNPSGLAALYVLGLLEMFYDEDLPELEARRLLLAGVTELKRIAEQGLPILITLSRKSSARARFVEIVRQAVDVWWEPSPSVIEELRVWQLHFWK